LDLLLIGDSENSIQEHLELTFMAVEPFLKPKEDGKHFLWPIAEQTKHFWDLLIIQYTRCSSTSELFAQRHYLVHMLEMISYKAMDGHYAHTLTNIVESQSFTELVPTSEVVDKLSHALSIDDEHLNYLVCLFSVGINWPAFFYSDDDDSQTMSFLFKILVKIISDKFPIHKLKVVNSSLLSWPELPWEKLTNEFLKHSFPDLPSKIALDSFVHPTSCHQKSLLLIREVFLNGEGNATVHDQERRRIWLGTIARCVKRSGVSKSDSSTLSRIPQFITDQLQWAITGIHLNEMDELEVSNLWGELLHIINYDNSLVEYFVQSIRMEIDLFKLRLYITTSNRIVKDPACQMMMMESAIHKAMTLGHGLALLQGTLCTLPFHGRDELRTTLCMTESFLTPLILLQEQLRPNLPVSTKVKLISQNAFYVKDAKPRKPSEWKLACFLHQIVRLTLSLWKTDKEDGNLQVFVHNDLLNLLGSFFYADTGSVLLNMIGLSSSSEPSIEFQLFVKALQELVSNFCKGLNRENLQEFALLGVQSTKFCQHEDFVSQLCDLIERPSVENTDEITRCWARLTDHHLASFYLDNP